MQRRQSESSARSVSNVIAAVRGARAGAEDGGGGDRHWVPTHDDGSQHGRRKREPCLCANATGGAEGMTISWA